MIRGPLTARTLDAIIFCTYRVKTSVLWACSEAWACAELRIGADTTVFSPENGNPSPTRQLVSSSCAYSHHRFPFLPVHALGVFQSYSKGDGGARVENRRCPQRRRCGASRCESGTAGLQRSIEESTR